MTAARVLLDVLFAGLWQGALIAILVGAILYFFGRRLNAATRYVVLQVALIAIVIVPPLTTLPNVLKGLTISAVEISGDNILPPSLLLAHMAARPGAKYSDAIGQADCKAVQDVYDKHGLVLGTCLPGVVPGSIDERAGTEKVQYAVWAARVGLIEITGNKQIKDTAIRDLLEQRPGTAVTKKLIQHDIDHLKNTGFFSKVDINPRECPNAMAQKDPGCVVLLWIVVERKNLSAMFPTAYLDGPKNGLPGGLSGMPVAGKVFSFPYSFRTASHRIGVTLGDRFVLLFVTIWLTGVLFFALRIGFSTLQLARLARRSVRIGDRFGIPVYRSQDVGVPLAMGLRRPMVVVPDSLAVGAEGEFDCALSHELAHVRRLDIWANAYEQMLHAFFFFNPAVFLTLRAIALEREAACDDRAVADSRDLDGYTRSLATFALQGTGTNFAAAACGALGFGRATVTRMTRLEDTHRNGTITLSRYALGGFTIMLASIAFILQALAPAIAFAPQTPAAPRLVAAVACKTHYQDATVVQQVTPDYPASVRKRGGGEVTVQDLVTIGPSGKIISAKVYRKSKYPELDRAALSAARQSTYAPKIVNCEPVQGTYLFRVTFDPRY